eukprot:1140635-Pelagomonas_calceolata.AAC.11
MPAATSCVQPPEAMRGTTFSMATDVYSFGVVSEGAEIKGFPDTEVRLFLVLDALFLPSPLVITLLVCSIPWLALQLKPSPAAVDGVTAELGAPRIG